MQQPRAPPATAGGSAVWWCVYSRRMRGDIPLAYFFTFRSYGTWLHGDGRGSVDRLHNQYGTPHFPAKQARQHQSERRLKHAPGILDSGQRESVSQAIRKTCEVRKWLLRALNVRTNHVHAVLSADVRPELALNALKANATRQLRHDGRWQHASSPWSDSGSRRYVWTEVGLERAIDYVVNGQDGPVPELDRRNRVR